MAKQDVNLQFSLIDGVTRSLTAIQQGVTGLGASIVKVNQAAELTGRAFNALGSVAGVLGSAVSGAASVEDALARISIRTQGTIEEQQALQAAIQAAVQGTRFSAEEAANALLLLVEDGASASEAIDALGSVLGYAQANAQSAAQATAGLGAVLDTFGEKPAVIGALADALQATAVAAGTSTQALQEGLAGVGVQAEQAGLTLNETIAALGVLATRGIEGGAAAKALNTALAALTNPASAAGKALADAGLEGKTFSETLAALSRDSTAAEAVLSTLGAKPRAALRLLLTEGGADLKAFAATINDSSGASEKAAETLNNTFNGALQRIQNQLGLLRDELLTPILQPIAQEVEALSGKLREFADSPQFDLLVQQFTKFATDGVQAIGKFVQEFDFAEALGSLQKFAADAKDTLFGLIEVANAVVTAFRGLKEFIVGTPGDVEAALRTIAPNIARVTDEVLRLQRAIELRDGVSGAKKVLADFASGASAAGSAAGSAAPRVDAFGKTLGDLGGKVGGTASEIKRSVAALDAFGNALADIGKEVEKTYPAFDDSKDAMQRLAGGATEAAIGLERLRIATLAAAQSSLAQAGLENTATFRALTVEIGKAEERIRALTEAQQKAKVSTDAQTGSTQQATGALREYASASAQAERSSSQLADRNSQVRQSFGNIGAAASETAISLGTMSEEYVRQALAAAGASKSIKGYLDTLNRQFEAGIEQQRQVADRLAQQEKLNRGLDEEAQALDRLRQQYPAIAEGELKKLYDAQKRYTELLERQNRTKREGLDLDQQAAANAAGVAGGLNTGRNAGQQQGADQGGGGSGGGVSSIINVNIAGVVTDDVAREIANRIARFQRLAR